MNDQPPPPRDRTRQALCLALALFYFVAGCLHLYLTAGFASIVPGWVPYPQATVIFTGLCEILGAVALWVPHLRKAAGLMLALYAVCVFPANIKHALDHIPVAGVVLGWGYHGPRLAFQPVLVWAALFAGNWVDWPFIGPEPRRGN